MNKQLLRISLLTAIILITISQFSFAQINIPSNLEGEELRIWLKDNYYSGHKTLGYTEARVKMYNYIDNHNNTITGVYSGYEKNFQYGGSGTSTDPINCEHTVPQSFFGKADPMKSDIHHLFPTYKNWNSTRSNYPFADIDDNETEKWMINTSSQSGVPSSNIDSYSEYHYKKFEPREDHKGNVARAIFYFYTMYPSTQGSDGSGISKVADIQLLYKWSLNDPIDDAEIARNELIEDYQGNRNPYIDHPSLISKAWNLTQQEITIPVAPSNLVIVEKRTKLDLTWDDLNNETSYNIYRKTEGGNYVFLASNTENDNTFSDNNVEANIVYYYNITASNSKGEGPVSNEVNGKLSENTGGSYTMSDLIISEYIEGSSYNKTLEIANFTGSAVDLSSYSFKKQANGKGNWGSELSLEGTLENLNTYTIVHTQADQLLLDQADLVTGSQSVNFNGNDPIGLFKNGVLIDMLGVLNVTSNFAIDITLIRKSTIVSPNDTFTIGEWNTKDTDYFDNFGDHIFDGSNLSTSNFDLGISIFPNPTNDFIKIKIDSDIVSVEIYNTTGSLVSKAKNSKLIDISNLNKGLYLIKIETDNKFNVLKIIKN